MNFVKKEIVIIKKFLYYKNSLGNAHSFAIIYSIVILNTIYVPIFVSKVEHNFKKQKIKIKKIIIWHKHNYFKIGSQLTHIMHTPEISIEIQFI